MSKKKKIPCRVCGTYFVPCAYCQSQNDVFRWRNFACSIECAKKYVNEAIAYINENKNDEAKKIQENDILNREEFVSKEEIIQKKRNMKKKAVVSKNNTSEYLDDRKL